MMAISTAAQSTAQEMMVRNHKLPKGKALFYADMYWLARSHNDYKASDEYMNMALKFPFNMKPCNKKSCWDSAPFPIAHHQFGKGKHYHTKDKIKEMQKELSHCCK